MKKLLFIMTFATILAACCGENSEKSGPQPLVIDNALTEAEKEAEYLRLRLCGR